ncbi:MAG: hypothetical protein EOO78_31865, partial [Oxalobacteraceae bacterium]
MSKQSILNASAMATLCALAAFSLQAKAQQQAHPASPQSSQNEAGMVVVRDAQTGKMRAPTPDELKALRARDPAPAALTAGAPPQHQALAPRRDGTRGVRLSDRTMVYDVVTRGADGKLSSECVHGAAAAEAALGGAPSAT